MKSFLTRMAIYVVLMIGITMSVNLYQASVAPTVTNTVALGQMSDTDEGHIAMRAYTHTTNNITPYVVVPCAIVLYLVVMGGSVGRLLKEAKTEPETE
jgi:Na+/H+ antiporter NhaC